MRSTSVPLQMCKPKECGRRNVLTDLHQLQIAMKSSTHPVRALTTLAVISTLVVVTQARRVGAQATLWIGRLGTDTVTAEFAARRGTRIEGVLISRAAGLSIQRYVADLDSVGHVRTLRVWSLRTPREVSLDTAPPLLEVAVEADSLRVRRAAGDSAVTQSVPSVPGVVPLLDRFLSPPLALLDLAVTRATRATSPSTIIYYVGTDVETTPLTQTGAGSWSLPYTLAKRYPMLRAARIHVRVDTLGLLEVDARETTFKLVTTRDAHGSAESVAREFMPIAEAIVRLGAGDSGPSSMSPLRRVTGHVGAVDVAVRYGQPSRRGRRVFPDVVPVGRVWRAGANAATAITFSGEVLVGGCPLSSGSYSLWVVPGVSVDTLVLNGVANTWGTMHDPSRDLLRVPMRREILSQPVEELTYAIDHGALTLLWDDRAMSVELGSASGSEVRCS